MRQKWILKSFLVFLLFIQSHLIGLWPSSASVFSGPVKHISGQDKIDPSKILKSYFTNKGYITGTIKIPELGILVKLRENQFYKKEENVKDVYARINEIRNQFGLSAPHSDASRGNGWCGVLYAECCEQKAFAYVVLIKEKLNDASRIYTLAHENGHFLWYIDNQEKIYRKFTDPELVKSGTQTNGDFAVLCGWAAMKTAGYSLKECFILNIRDKVQEKNIERIKNLVDQYFHDENIGNLTIIHSFSYSILTTGK